MIDPLQKAVENRDVAKIADTFFDADIYNQQGQQEIVRSVAFDDEDRVITTAPTRYGKTYAVALGAAVYLLLHEDKVVNEIAPVMNQAKKFRQYLVDFILTCPELRNRLDIDTSGAERMRKEVSKKRFTFEDGNEVRILTAGGSDTAKSLMGEGGDLNILDESCDIDAEIYRKRISRMLGDSPDAKLVEIGNPWRKDNHFFDHWKSEDFHTIHIDWEQAVDEGRLSEDFVEEQRRQLTDTEFQVLYEATFPDAIEGGLIKYSWIEEALEKDSFEFENDEKVVGVDVAEKGGNKTVATSVFQEGNKVNVAGWSSWSGLDPTESIPRFEEILHGHETVTVDAIGVGSGLPSRLRELDYHAVGVKVSKSPNVEKDRFLNQKALYYWRLRSLFQDERISLPEDDVPQELIDQLSMLRYEITSSGKIKIIDPETGSPDFADSLMLACSRTQTKGGGSTETGTVSLV